MGGFGSGRRTAKKMPTEVCMTLDTADLKRMGVLGRWFAECSGVIRWPGVGGTASEVEYTRAVTGDGVTLGLTYQMPGHATPIRLPCGW